MKTSAPRRWWVRVLAATVAGLLIAAAAAAQFGREPFRVRPNIPYDGRFTFVRLKYTTAPGGYWTAEFDDTNEAYKLGVNYIVYGLTH